MGGYCGWIIPASAVSALLLVGCGSTAQGTVPATGAVAASSAAAGSSVPIDTGFTCYFTADAGASSVTYRFRVPHPVISKVDGSKITNCLQYDRVLAQSTLGKYAVFAGDQTSAPASLAGEAPACSSTADSGVTAEVLDDRSGEAQTICKQLGWS